MMAIKFIAAVLFSAAAAITIVFVIIRIIRINRRWKVAEPELIADLEKSLGQRIVYKTALNANDSTDFVQGKGFWLWLAFTHDYAVFADRDYLACKNEGVVYISKRADASIKRLENKFAELELKDMKSAEPFRFVVLVRTCDYESISNFIAASPR